MFTNVQLTLFAKKRNIKVSTQRRGNERSSVLLHHIYHEDLIQRSFDKYGVLNSDQCKYFVYTSVLYSWFILSMYRNIYILGSSSFGGVNCSSWLGFSVKVEKVIKLYVNYNETKTIDYAIYCQLEERYFSS